MKTVKLLNMNTRISTDLDDPRLIKLLKFEAQSTGTTMKSVLKKALESYFGDKLETRALAKAAESIFDEWDDPRDSEYDSL
jgi:hypothetical protein